ncbi:acylphosphatase [Diaminobutyricimonas sp. TR449]|uniref:acylphosphatase n=1 Tax=Diaminobutyricimonas sp. TR449 TaxID=2708076 RepID=UPI0014225406|nr:acylphosphatase [Diaminobutyricimonas sp. TR449]
MIRKQVTVFGLVQGVGFRYSAQAEATRLGITGFVRNRQDGAVEAQLEGDEESVAHMVSWLRAGPRGARVERVDVTDLEVAGDTEFRITW